MGIKLIKIDESYKDLVIEMIEEWKEYKSNNKDEFTPYSIFKNDYKDFSYFLDNLEIKKGNSKLVPDSTFFLYDDSKNILIGAINIRHSLNDYLLKYGGHIGNGIRPSLRNLGYGTKIIELGLKECKKLGITKVLMTCNKNNIGSKKAIINNGGILENEVIKDNEIIERYWIDLSK